MPSPKHPPLELDPALDFARYTRAPRLPAAQCVPLAIRIAQAAPRDLRPLERTALDRVRHHARTVQQVLSARAATGRGRVRPKLDELTRAWACCSAVLDGYARLPTPRGARAAALQGILLRGGLTFLSGRADAAWFEAHRRLARLAAESSQSELIAVVGDDVAVWVERATSELGEMIGCGSTAVVQDDPRLLARAIRALQGAIVAYARAVFGNVDDEDSNSAELRAHAAPVSAGGARASGCGSTARATERDVDAGELAHESGEVVGRLVTGLARTLLFQKLSAVFQAPASRSRSASRSSARVQPQ